MRVPVELKYGPYSPSRLSTANCPFDFYNKYVHPNNTPKVETLPQARGSAVHEVFEKITKRFCERKESEFYENEVGEWVEDAVRKHPAALSETLSILNMARLYISKPPQLITTDAEIELKLAVRWDNTKQDFVECGYDDPKAFARGRADILVISDDTTSAIVYDHKSQPDIEDADTFQMGFYAWVISKIYPFLDNISTVLHFAKYGTYSEAYTWTREELKNREEDIITRISIIEGFSEWPAIAHDKCNYCTNQHKCPLIANSIEISTDGVVKTRLDNFDIFDTDKAVYAASLITAMEESVKTLKSNLKAFVNQTGPIAIPGKVFQFSGEEKINWGKVNKFGREQVYNLCERYNVDVKRYMSFNQTATPSIWKMESNSEFLKELSSILPRKTYVEFGGKKL